MVPGVATLDRMVRSCLQWVRPIFHSHGGLRKPEGRCPTWGEYRSGGTGGTHPGMDILPDLSPRAKPYCAAEGCTSLPRIVELAHAGDTILPQ